MRACEEAVLDASNAAFGRYSVFAGICGIHIRRLGGLRVTVGGQTQYLAIPMFALLHAHLVLADRLGRRGGLPPIEWQRYLVLDRHLVRGLCWYDRLNCLYCDWANGLCKLLTDRLALMARRPRRNLHAGSLAQGAVIPFWMGQIAYLAMLYTVIHKSLGMQPVSLAAAFRGAREAKDERSSRPDGRAQGPTADGGLLAIGRELRDGYVVLGQTYGRYLTEILSEIESTWCPLHHIRDGVFQEHHKYFFDPDQLRLMESVLLEWGSAKARAAVVENDQEPPS